MPRELPSSTAEFIRKYIHSLEHIEILLLLQGSPQRDWTVDQVFEQVRSNVQSVESHLQQLRAQGFIEAAESSNPEAYRYRPASSELAAGVEDLAAIYKERRVTVIEHIFAEPPSPIQGFADSFRIRKDDKHG